MPGHHSQRGRGYVPERVDVDALRRELSSFLSSGGLTPTTLNGYRNGWSRWERFCAALPDNPDPLAAPFSAFVALLASDIPEASLPCVLNGIRHRYREHGRTPAFDETAFSDRWQEARRGRRRQVRRSPRSEESKTGKAAPLLREDLIRLLAAEPPPMGERDTAFVAACLLLLDHRVEVTKISGVRLSDAVFTDSNAQVDVGGQRIELACDHVERVRGVPWDCTMCAIRSVHAARVGLGSQEASNSLLFGVLAKTRGDVSKALRGRLEAALTSLRAGGWDWATPQRQTLTGKAGTDSWALAGVRRALVTGSHHPHGQAVARARCRIAVAWANGLRLASDLDEVRRDLIKRDDHGYTFVLGPTKSDRSGARSRVIAAHGDAEAFGVGRYFAEYLCVRDATVGRDGYLFTPMRGKKSGFLRSSPEPDVYHSALVDLRTLARLAGVEGLYTTYSIRRGHAAQRQREGHPLERIQAGLGHCSPTTTVGYIDSHTESASESLMRGLVP